MTSGLRTQLGDRDRSKGAADGQDHTRPPPDNSSSGRYRSDDDGGW
jgi:hypothetical protein